MVVVERLTNMISMNVRCLIHESVCMNCTLNPNKEIICNARESCTLLRYTCEISAKPKNDFNASYVFTYGLNIRCSYIVIRLLVFRLYLFAENQFGSPSQVQNIAFQKQSHRPILDQLNIKMAMST